MRNLVVQGCVAELEVRICESESGAGAAQGAVSRINELTSELKSLMEQLEIHNPEVSASFAGTKMEQHALFVMQEVRIISLERGCFLEIMKPELCCSAAGPIGCRYVESLGVLLGGGGGGGYKDHFLLYIHILESLPVHGFPS